MSPGHRKPQDYERLEAITSFMTRCAIAVAIGVAVGLALQWWVMP